MRVRPQGLKPISTPAKAGAGGAGNMAEEDVVDLVREHEGKDLHQLKDLCPGVDRKVLVRLLRNAKAAGLLRTTDDGRVMNRGGKLKRWWPV
jgi:hypothetical protein